MSASKLPFVKKDKRSGTGGGNGMSTEERLTRVEVKIDHIESDIKEIKSDIKELRVDTKEIRNEMRSDFRWLLGILITAFTALGALMAHGFKWF